MVLVVAVISGGAGLVHWLAHRSVYTHECSDGALPDTLSILSVVGAGHGGVGGHLNVRLDADHHAATVTRAGYGMRAEDARVTEAEARALLQRLEQPSAFADEVEAGKVEIEINCRGTPHHWEYDLHQRDHRFHLSRVLEHPFAADDWAGLWRQVVEPFTINRRALVLGAGVVVETFPAFKR
jgi:hypothetical protein